MTALRKIQLEYCHILIYTYHTFIYIYIYYNYIILYHIISYYIILYYIILYYIYILLYNIYYITSQVLFSYGGYYAPWVRSMSLALVSQATLEEQEKCKEAWNADLSVVFRMILGCSWSITIVTATRSREYNPYKSYNYIYYIYIYNYNYNYAVCLCPICNFDGQISWNKGRVLEVPHFSARRWRSGSKQRLQCRTWT